MRSGRVAALAAIVVAAGFAGVARPAHAAGVRIAVLDSGIEATHPEFAPGQVVGWNDFVNEVGTPYDDLGHGTGVASRAAGKTTGALPGADLLIGKVLNSANQASWNDVADGIEWAADEGADVINVSLWAQLPSPAAHALTLARAIDYATGKGSLVMWIAGNGGPTTPSTVLPGAASAQALVVGASNQTGAPASFSQRDPEVIAWGVGVRVATTGGGYTFGSGTSFAAPFAAGVAARLRAAGAPKDPSWLKWVLLHSATDQSYSYLEEGYGLLDTAAVNRALAVAGGTAPMPPFDTRDAFHLGSAAARTAQSGSVPAGAIPPS